MKELSSFRLPKINELYKTPSQEYLKNILGCPKEWAFELFHVFGQKILVIPTESDFIYGIGRFCYDISESYSPRLNEKTNEWEWCFCDSFSNCETIKKQRWEEITNGGR